MADDKLKTSPESPGQDRPVKCLRKRLRQCGSPRPQKLPSRKKWRNTLSRISL